MVCPIIQGDHNHLSHQLKLLNHPALQAYKRLATCTIYRRQEGSTASCSMLPTHLTFIPSLSQCRSLCQKWQLFFIKVAWSESQWTVLLRYLINTLLAQQNVKGWSRYLMTQKYCQKFEPSEQGARTLQTTDRQTDRQTDRRTGDSKWRT